MRKAIIALVTLAVFITSSAFALENSFLDMRSELVDESGKVKELLNKTKKDLLAVSSMWDTCLITISQIDAYFDLLGLFNSVPEKNLNQESADCLTKWMAQIRKTNDMNIKMLSQMSSIVEPATQSHMQMLKDYFQRLNAKIDAEVIKINALKMTMNKNAAS